MGHKPVAAGKSSFDLVDREAAFAERIGARGTVYAVDLWEEGIAALDREIRHQGIENIKTLVANISDTLPLAGESFDACLIATVLHDLSKNDQHAALREVARLLRPGGHLNIIEFKKIDKGPGPPVAKKMDEEEVEALATEYGFAKVAGCDVGEFTYLLKFEKST
jgi:ubiquinone/menaquinone biosynthesis C-methylase UbiE